MRRVVFVYCVCALLYNPVTKGATYRTAHFTIHSDMDSRYVSFIVENAESFYESMLDTYFDKGWQEPLGIVYSRSQSDTQKLFGDKQKIYYGIYVPSKNAIYTHRYMDDGGTSGWGTLFHEITHHFVRMNFVKPPTWFNEGLTCILSEHARVVMGRLSLGRPNPWREHRLRDMLNGGYKVDVKHLTRMSNKEFDSSRDNYHPLRALFYFLYEKGFLLDYVKNVKGRGYDTSVLEQTCRATSDEIGRDVLKFIKSHCYAGAYLQDAYLAKDISSRKAALTRSLELKPGYRPAQMELARCFYREKDYDNCTLMVAQVLQDRYCPERKDALKLCGDMCYTKKKYAEAIEFYERALEYSEGWEYSYQISYCIANSSHGLRNIENAVKWHRHFLESNWEPERLQKWTDYSKGYVDRFGE